MRRSLIIIVLAVMAVACENVTCSIDNTVESVYSFYASARTDGVFYPGNAITIGDTMSVIILGPDSVIANRLVRQKEVKLPVSFYGAVDSLLFEFTDTASRKGRDTLFVFKMSMPHWEDPSCPVHMFHVVTAVTSTHNIIDTVLIINPTITYEGLENFRIYFRTNDEEE